MEETLQKHEKKIKETLDSDNSSKNQSVKFFEFSLFESRWLLLLFYYGLIIGLAIYGFVFLKTTAHIIIEAPLMNKEMAMLSILELVDMAMVANLVKMIITGSYNSFISKNHGYKNENITSGMLKIKMSTSLVGVSSIHLLQSFLMEQAPENLKNQIIIHCVFLIGSLMLAVIEYLHEKGESISKTNNH